MKPRPVTLAALAAFAALAGCKSDQRKPAPAAGAPAAAAPAAAPVDDQGVAIAFVTHLARGEAAAALALAPPGLKLTAAELGAQWTERAGVGNALVEVTARAFPADPSMFSVRATLATGTLDSFVMVKDGRIARAMPGQRYDAPAYVDPKAFTDVAFTVGSGATALPGLLSVPAGGGRFPVVVLLQGSGPSDLDESDGRHPLALFRDLAWGLASRGVAVLRYDKRTLPVHFAAIGVPVTALTVQHEYFDDLGHALDGLALDPRIDAQRIFVLGHSQAGGLLPWMMRDRPDLAGGIIASGNARALVDLLPEQTRYLTSLDPAIPPAQHAEIAKQLAAQVARAHDPKLADDASPSTLPLGIPARYWKFLQGYDAPAVAATLDRPFLVLQGGRDYNVTMVDLALWKRALVGHDATFHDYPALDHHYVAGTGLAKPADLAVGGHAAPAVIDDVATWVAAQHPHR